MENYNNNNINTTTTTATNKTAAHTVAEFSISFTRYLNKNGQLEVKTLPASVSDVSMLIKIYKTMCQTRGLDQKAINLQRTGKLGTYGSVLGQEAIGAAISSTLQSNDVIFITYRELSAQLWRGVGMEEILTYWGGDERGNNYEIPREDFPICIPIASHALHAVGVAYAMKLKKQPRVAVCFIGDGATSKGDFSEALNAAGVWRLPVLFIVSNNQWAISVPVSKQTGAETLAQKAIAAGFGAEQVDGNDVLALRATADKAVKQIREGGGPYLIEALTYRMSDHTTSDDWRRYRSESEVEKHKEEDPIKRLNHYLTSISAWNDEKEKSLMLSIENEIEEVVKHYQKSPPQRPESIFDYLYEKLPESLQKQRKQLIQKALLEREEGLKGDSDE